MKKNKKLMLTAIAAMGIAAVGIGGMSTFAWYGIAASTAGGQLKSAISVVNNSPHGVTLTPTVKYFKNNIAEPVTVNAGTDENAGKYDFDALSILVADMEGEKFVNKVNYGGSDVISSDSTNVCAIWIHIAGTNPESTDHLRYDLKVTATFTGSTSAADPAIKYATALAANSSSAGVLTSGSETVVGTSTADAAVNLDVFVWLDGTVPTAYEAGTFNLSFAVALHTGV